MPPPDKLPLDTMLDSSPPDSLPPDMVLVVVAGLPPRTWQPPVLKACSCFSGSFPKRSRTRAGLGRAGSLWSECDCQKIDVSKTCLMQLPSFCVKISYVLLGGELVLTLRLDVDGVEATMIALNVALTSGTVGASAAQVHAELFSAGAGDFFLFFFPAWFDRRGVILLLRKGRWRRFSLQ